MSTTPDVYRLRTPAKIIGQVEIARSFSYKLNTGNYESRDFFCSQKASCSMEDADEISTQLYEFCQHQVLTAVREYRQKMDTQRSTQIERKSA